MIPLSTADNLKPNFVNVFVVILFVLCLFVCLLVLELVIAVYRLLFDVVRLSVCLSTVAVPPMIVSDAHDEIAYRVREVVEIPCVATGDPPAT